MAAFGIVAILFATGCSSIPKLPNNKAVVSGLPVISEGASPVYSWRSTQLAHTYWGAQEVTVSARAHVPQPPQDAVWEARAHNSQGKNIPYLGIVHKRKTESGEDVRMMIDPKDFPDGLYVAIDPNITVADGQVAAIQPVAVLLEIRKHIFKPFACKVPLVPEQDSPLTPRPEIKTEPEGTTVPF